MKNKSGEGSFLNFLMQRHNFDQDFMLDGGG